MRILLFLYIFFEQFNIKKFKMRPQRTFQNSKLKILASSPIQELEPGVTPCRGGRCAAAISRRPQQHENKILY